MPYISSTDLIQSYTGDRLRDIINETSTDYPDDSLHTHPQIIRALAAANSEAEGYVRSQYPLPLKHVPPALAAATVDLAVTRLLSMFPEKYGDTWKAQRSAAIKYLEEVSKGTHDWEFQSAKEETAVSPALLVAAPVDNPDTRPASSAQTWFARF